MREINKKKVFVDVRPISQKIFDFLYDPDRIIFLLIPFVFLQIYYSALWFVWTILCLIYLTSMLDVKINAPLRIPKDIKVTDNSDFHDEKVKKSYLFGLIKAIKVNRIFHKASGILYLGFTRDERINTNETGKELWITNSDARTHMFVGGTTGSGKTETLLGIYVNSLMWGSGNIYADGKGQTSLPFIYSSLAKRFGRDDDVLILNYLTGGRDPTKEKVEAELNKDTIKLSQSNSYNPFSEGSADSLQQLISSLLPTASGDAKQWQDKAINMMDALIRTLAYFRANGEIDISIEDIRESLSLGNLVKFYQKGIDGDIPEHFFTPIKTYFDTCLPGFRAELINQPINEWDQEIFNQHGYLTSQFSRLISMLCDSYGFIFKDKYPEIDMSDVIINNRLLVILIPTMEKSAQEASALGKLFVSSTRLVMAENLGSEIEGNQKEVLDTKATNSPNPFTVILDELGYYFASGLAVMFAQARSLSFMLIAAAQDVQALKRGEGSEEWASVLANTKIKQTLALEDPEETFEVFKKAGSDGYYSVSSGHHATNNLLTSQYEAQDNINLQRLDRINLKDLKNLEPGESVILFKDKIVKSSNFYINDDDKKTIQKIKINRFIQVERPTFKILNNRYPKEKEYYEELADTLSTNTNNLTNCILADEVYSNLLLALTKINENDYSVLEKGILLFTSTNFSIKNNKNFMEHSEIDFIPEYLDPSDYNLEKLID